MAVISWGEWRPDLSDFNGSYSATILNAMPRGDGYGPFPSLTTYSGALPGRCRGLFRALNTDATVTIFAATETRLYMLDNSTLSWVDVSKSPLPFSYSLDNADNWSFAQFENRVVATQAGDPPQVFTLGISTSFADLAGSPPHARYVSTVGRFLVLSGLLETPFRIQWSAIDNIEGWTAGTDQSDFQDFPDGGIVRGVVGGEIGLVFQDTAIRRMIYAAGSPIIFQIERVTTDLGIQAPLSLTRAGDQILFYSSSGFYKMTPTGYPMPIGKERVDRTFRADWSDGDMSLFIGAGDPRSSRVLWAYRSINGSDDQFDTVLIYDYLIDRWAKIDMTGEFIVPLAQPGMTLEGIDTAFPAYNLDTLPFSLDDFPTASTLEIVAVNSDHEMCLFTGPALEAVMETAEMGETFQRVFVRGFRPVTDAAGAMGSISTRSRLQDSAVQTTETAINATGFCPQRRDTRLFRGRLRVPSGEAWTFASGVEFDAVQGGER
ncbi:hypothetical protein [Xanthobacter versatilis]|uniref:hypothetical protein n=1 Tax=Xanthobacter autotrophicus (strain ATCC BAA-1158 / Py2) TaxID=78245 RepID=UPI0037294EB8